MEIKRIWAMPNKWTFTIKPISKLLEEIDMKEVLHKWDNGENVWSIEMGGIGPGYEQAIQVGIFELCRDLIELKFPESEEDLNNFFDKALSNTIKRVGGFLSGLSGAQAGAIKHVAYKFLTKGYEEVLKSIPEDRKILVNNRIFIKD